MSEMSRGPVTWSELTAGLIWPRIFRAAPLALHPSRMLIAFIAVALMMAVGTTFDSIAGPIAPEFTPPDTPMGLFRAILGAGAAVVTGFSFSGAARALGALAEIVSAYPWRTALLFLLLIPFWAGAGVAICRMALCDAAAEMRLSAAEGLAFSLRRIVHGFLALAIPALLLGLLALVLAVAGLLLLRLPVVNIVGALLYGLFLMGGLAFVALGLIYIVGSPLMLPAIAAESADWVDAIQRAYAYVLGRTGRLAVYYLVAILFGAIVIFVAHLIFRGGVNLTARLAFAWAGLERPLHDVAGGVNSFADSLPRRATDLSGSDRGMAAIIGLWEKIVAVLFGAFVLSYFFCASSIVYLFARRVNDEQDFHEIWLPGMIPGALSPTAEPAADARRSN